MNGYLNTLSNGTHGHMACTLLVKAAVNSQRVPRTGTYGSNQAAAHELERW
jgi:hypothetical protein